MSIVLDTSVFVALESGRPARVELLPEQAFVTVITRAELEAGVLAAGDVAIRAQRLGTVQRLAQFEMLAVDEAAGRAWAQLRVQLRDAGRAMKINDLWIASIALAAGVGVATQDDDFDVLAELGLLDVIKI